MLKSLAISVLCCPVLIVSPDVKRYEAKASCYEAVSLNCSLAGRNP